MVANDEVPFIEGDVDRRMKSWEREQYLDQLRRALAEVDRINGEAKRLGHGDLLKEVIMPEEAARRAEAQPAGEAGEAAAGDQTSVLEENRPKGDEPLDSSHTGIG